MQLLILRGGASQRRRLAGASRASAVASTSTGARGVVAIGNGSGRWVLVNMSPAVAHQLDSDHQLDRYAGLPGTDQRALLLTDSQVDHVAGLLSLRNGAPIALYATPAVFEELTTGLPVLPVLQHYCALQWQVVPVAGDRPVASFRVEGMAGLEFTALATQAPLLPHLAHSEHPRVGDSIALAVRDLANGQRLFYAPGLAHFGALEIEWMRDADCVLVDSPASQPGGTADAAPADWLALLRGLPARHKLLLGDAEEADDADPANAGAQRAAWAAQGLQLTYDGMEITL